MEVGGCTPQTIVMGWFLMYGFHSWELADSTLFMNGLCIYILPVRDLARRFGFEFLLQLDQAPA